MKEGRRRESRGETKIGGGNGGSKWEEGKEMKLQFGCNNI